MGATPVPVREIGRFAQEFEASGWDGLEFLAAGANAVQVGSAAFKEPLLARRIREELATLLAQRGLAGVGALKTTTLD